MSISETHQFGLIQSGHDSRYEDQLDDDARHSIYEGSSEESLKRESVTGYPENYPHSKAPYQAACDHSDDQTAIDCTHALLSGSGIQNSDHQSICCQFKSHGDSGRIHRRHAEDRRPQKRQDESHRQTILPAADQRAQKHREMHRTKHIPNELNVSCDEGQYQSDSHEHRRNCQFLCRRVPHINTVIISEISYRADR